MRGFLHKFILGLGLIAVGSLYMLNQLGWTHFDISHIFTVYWPLIIIYFGLRGLLFQRSHRGGSLIWSFFIIFVGVYFLLRNLGIDGFSFDNMYKFIIPVLLILFGLKILFHGTSFQKDYSDHGGYSDRQTRKQERILMRQQMRQQMKQQMKHQMRHHAHEHDHQTMGHDKINRSSFIGDIHIGHDGWDLIPLNVSSFIGDTVIDLTRANVPLGETKINVSSFIGDLKIYIPNDIQIGVLVAASTFISDIKVLERYESGLFKHVETQSNDYVDASKKIRIHISAFIGDIIVIRVG